MNTAQFDAPLPVRQSPAANSPRRRVRRWWSGITALLAATYFVQAAIAGAMMSGVAWARQAHAMTAAILIASSLVASLIALISLRRAHHGPRLGLTLLLLAVAAFVQAAVGSLSAKGENLTWVHVPLGVALIALAGQAAASARKLGGD